MRSRARNPEPAHRARRGQRGFTLAELTLAASLGALLLVSMALATSGLTETVALLEADSSDAYDKALARITRDVRYAWWVDTPSPTQLRVADSANRVTEYYAVGNSLLVRLPSGDEGAVVTGLDSISFAADTMQRLREAAARTVSGSIYALRAPPTASGALKLNQGNQLALGLYIRSPAGPGTVAGIDESLLTYTPTRLDLRIARVTAAGQLRVDFYPARAPGDARPRPGAASLLGFDFDLSGLPNAVVLVPSARGDITEATYAPPVAAIPMAIPASTTLLSPGTSYAVVLTVGPGAMVVLAGYANPAGANSNLQFSSVAGASWTALPGVTPFEIFGDRFLTATSAYTVAAAIHATLDPSSGAARSSSAPNYSQSMATDAWLGVVPGELAPAP
ncbi:MAG TPA: hypothetical protein VFD43_03270 [Planctomycetota bacterium]|nr:hypothetical protein [Planctomycetota bacterium]